MPFGWLACRLILQPISPTTMPIKIQYHVNACHLNQEAGCQQFIVTTSTYEKHWNGWLVPLRNGNKTMFGPLFRISWRRDQYSQRTRSYVLWRWFLRWYPMRIVFNYSQNHGWTEGAPQTAPGLCVSWRKRSLLLHGGPWRFRCNFWWLRCWRTHSDGAADAHLVQATRETRKKWSSCFIFY